MNRRSELLDKLARRDGPCVPLLDELRSMGWDWSGDPLLLLTKDHFLSVIDRFLSGALSAEQVEEWAESLELREDVGFADGADSVLDDVLFCLANPAINLEISHDSVRQLRQRVLGA